MQQSHEESRRSQTGDTPVEIRAVFPSTVVRLDCVERNPAPGTEGAPPQATTYDMATGDFTVHGPTQLLEGYR